MRIPRPRPGPRRRLRLPRRTAQLRLTVLYGAAFLVCGAAVLAVVTYLVFGTSPDSSGPPAAIFNGKVPAAAVHRAGGTDIVPFPIPIADIQHAGRYDLVRIRMPIAPSQLPAVTAAQRAREAAAEVQVNYDKRQILLISAIALAAIALTAAGIGWIIAGRVLRPLSTITAAARRIAASSLHERLALPGPDDELKELGDTLDGLFARLQASFEAQQRFAANTSHELRTPLTRERTLLQVTLADPASTTDTCRPSAESCSPRTPSRNASSRRCSPWPAAKPAPARPSPSTWRRSAAKPWPLPAPRSAAWACTSRPTFSRPSSTVTRSLSSGW